MLNVVIDARLFSQLGGGGLGPVLSPVLGLAGALSSLGDLTALDGEPVVTPTQLVFSDASGTVTAFGRGFAQDAEGNLSGTLERIVAVKGDRTVLDATLSAGQLVLKQGTQTVTMDGTFPTGLGQVQGFVAAFGGLLDGVADPAVKAQLLAELEPYALTRAVITDDKGAVLGTLTPAATEVLYQAGGYALRLEGRFQQNFATLAEMAIALSGAGTASLGDALGAIHALDSVDLSRLTMTDPQALLLLQTIGDFAPVNGVVVNEVVTLGTAGPDIYVNDLAEALGARVIRARLAEGDDRAQFDGDARVEAVMDGSVPLAAQPQTIIDGGPGRDTLSIFDFEGTAVTLNFGTGVLLGSTAPAIQPAQVYYDVRATGFEVVSAEVYGRFAAIGTAAAERVILVDASDFLFVGDGGFDVLDLSKFEYFARDGEGYDDAVGITRAFFAEHFTIAPNGVGGHTITHKGTGGDGFPRSGTIVDVEAIQFVDSTPALGLVPLRALVPIDAITLTPGPDTFVGTFLDETVNALAGNDSVDGGGGADRIIGGPGNDTLRGGDGADTLNGGDGDDFIWGGDSAADLRDLIYGGDGRDWIDAGHGNDLVYAGNGNDTVDGGFGVDEIQGQGGDDVLTGSAFSDLIFGGDGSDFINGGFGSDRVNGGAGADRFYHIGFAGHGSDWVQDFSSAEGDRLVFGSAGVRSQFQVNFNETAGAGAAGVAEAFVIYRPTGQILWALVDGAAQDSITLQVGTQLFDLLA
jgi:hypothetical protein